MTAVDDYNNILIELTLLFFQVRVFLYELINKYETVPIPKVPSTPHSLKYSITIYYVLNIVKIHVQISIFKLKFLLHD